MEKGGLDVKKQVVEAKAFTRHDEITSTMHFSLYP